jgi:uncharacterized protein (TIGR03083 family)
LAEVLATADPDTQVPTCPDWNAIDLLWHLTEVHLFWAAVLDGDVRDDEAVGAVESSKPERPETVGALLDMRARATGDLVAALARLDDAQPRWSWWPSEQTVGFTRRMQTYEAAMHRIDAELTAGVPVTPLDADVAAGAIDHAIDVMWGWMPDWADYEPLGVAELRATDEVGHWTGTGPESGKEFDQPRAVRASGGEATVSASAPVVDLARWAWSRDATANVEGDPRGVAALETLISNGMQ